MRRLDQLLANLGYCSRREASDWVGAGRVTIDGKPAANPAQKADPAMVRIDGEGPDHPGGLLLLLHKPAGVVCSHASSEGPRVYDLLPGRWQRRNPTVTSVGRLDRDTTGVLLLTDQTPLVHRLTSPRSGIVKVYRAILDRDVPAGDAEAMIRLFASGSLVLSGEKDPCLPAVLRWLGPREAELELTEGRYHQVKRMFESQGLRVATLHRERFGRLGLDGLVPGQWRELSLNEAIA